MSTEQSSWEQLNPNEGYNKRLDQLFVSGGYPVLVHSAGQYPVAVNTNGESTQEVSPQSR